MHPIEIRRLNLPSSASTWSFPQAKLNTIETGKDLKSLFIRTLLIPLRIGWALFFALPSLADPEPGPSPLTPDQTEPQKPQFSSSSALLEDLPEIEAATFDMQLVRKSISNRIFLFDAPDQNQPKVGQILLIKEKESQDPIMGLRVMKVYSKEKRIAAKKIKVYRELETLEPQSAYYTVEKLSDIPPPALTSLDKADIREIEQMGQKKAFMYKAPAFDPELDSDTTPHTEESPGADANLPDEEADSHLAITVEQPVEFDPLNHWITAGIGFARNSGPPSSQSAFYFSSGNLRYGYTVKKYLYFDRPNLQDSLTVEGGFYLYKAINYVTQGDAYTVLALNLALRYNLFFTPTFAVFGYTGLMQHNVISSNQVQAAGLAALSSIVPAIGVGFLTEIGPSWFVRADVGLDSIGLNLVLRF